MNKTIVFLSASGDPAALGDWLRSDFGPELAPHCAELTLNLVLPGEHRSRWDAALEIKAPDDTVFRALNDTALRSRVSHMAAYTTTELVGKDDGLVRGRPTPGIKLVAAWTGRSDVAPTERRRHWDEHVPLANRIHVGVRRYVRNWVESLALAPTPHPPAYQGIATQQFDSLQDLQERSFDKPESVPVIQNDVADFLDQVDVLITTEHCFPTQGK